MVLLIKKKQQHGIQRNRATHNSPCEHQELAGLLRPRGERPWHHHHDGEHQCNYYIYFYGADIEIEYTEASGDKVYIKSNGSWVEVAKAYKKVIGAWVEQTDLARLFSEGKVIIKGN